MAGKGVERFCFGGTFGTRHQNWTRPPRSTPITGSNGSTIERLLAGIEASGMRPRGRHHEIYLGDPRGLHPIGFARSCQPIEHALPT
jgi:hypothetical protein